MEDRLVATRDALHAVAEHVLAAARHASDGRIGLQVDQRHGGFTTPAFGDAPTTVAVRGTQLVVRQGDVERRAPLTTLRAAAQFAGSPLGAPEQVYRPATSCDPDAPLALDPAAARRIADWYVLVDDALRRFAAEITAAPVAPVLWPEHFDVAVRADDINFGGLAGDAAVPAPYVYVGPGPERSGDPFFDLPFGAALTWDHVRDAADALAFFRVGRDRALAG